MNIIYFGYDNVISCLYKMIEMGHHIEAIYTGPADAHNKKIMQCAHKKNIPLYSEPPELEKFQEFWGSEIDIIFSAEYPWKIPLTDHIRFAINLHPTLLPFGKGKTPLPHILLEFPQYAGISIHKLDMEMDGGDIILQRPLTVSDTETYDSLVAKIYVQAGEMTALLLDNLEKFYSQATPQDKGSYWPEISSEQRRIDWTDSTYQILKQIRAFGSLGTIAYIQNRKTKITTASGTESKHEFNPGTVTHENEMSLTIATLDGFITILKSSLTIE